jgi:two-component system LytT family response regulator
MEYKCIIVEDNLIESDLLESLIQEIDFLNIIGKYSNGLQAASILQTSEVDIVFSDIDMPKLSGIDLLKSLKKPPVFIFTSAHKHYAAESYDLDVADFIVKPVVLSRLLRAVEKAIEIIKVKGATSTEFTNTSEISTEFYINTSHGLIKILVKDVAYIESEANYSTIFTVKGVKHLVLANLKNLEAQLPSNLFTRVHRQYIVNKQNINVINQSTILLEGNYELPISSTFKKNLLESVPVLERLAKKQQ